jgi:hypothetical protein
LPPREHLAQVEVAMLVSTLMSASDALGYGPD